MSQEALSCFIRFLSFSLSYISSATIQDVLHITEFLTTPAGNIFLEMFRASDG